MGHKMRVFLFFNIKQRVLITVRCVSSM